MQRLPLAAAAFAGLGWAEPRILSSLTRFATLRQAAEMSTVAVLLLPSDYRLGPF